MPTRGEYCIVNKRRDIHHFDDSNRRAYPRVVCQDAVWLFPPRVVGGRAGLAMNISRGGIFVLSECPLTVGEVLTVEFNTDRFRIRVGGEVIWVRRHRQAVDDPPGIGIHFRSQSDPVRTFLGAHVDKLLLSEQAARERAMEAPRPTIAPGGVGGADIDAILRGYIIGDGEG